MTQTHATDVLRFAAAEPSAALCILTHVTGGTLRAKGAMMAVTERGHIGYISNGCVDGDILFQAREALKDGKARHLIYGEGSPFKDISLPCGGTLNITLIPNPDKDVLSQAAQVLSGRRAVHLSISEDQGLSVGPAMSGFSHLYTPPLRLRLAGRGEAALKLCQSAKAAGFNIVLQSPDADLSGQANPQEFHHLTDPNAAPPMEDDAWTAVVLLFHDHDWETALLKQALDGPAFYIGAMGSEMTHQARLAKLSEAGVDPSKSAKIHGPIGLIPAMRDANSLAVSVLAEIVQVAVEVS